MAQQKKDRNKSPFKREIKINKNIPSYDEKDHPFLARKLEDAIKTLERNPIPEWLLNRTKKPD